MVFRRSFKMIIGISLAAALLSGCGESFPVLTQEEYNLIVDYSAGVLSKYSKGNGDRLTRVRPDDPEEGETTAESEQSEPPAEKPVKQPDKTPVAADTTSTDTTASDKPDDSPIVVRDPDGEPGDGGEDMTLDGKAEQPADDVQDGEDVPEPADETSAAPEVAIGNGDLLQKMQDGLEVTFNGYYVLNSYPDSTAQEYASIKADAGKKLLILSFTMTNHTPGELKVDLLNANPTFTLYINGEPVSRQMVTVLDNDMGTYMGTIPGGGSVSSVLCFNVKEAQAKSINTMSLKLNLRGEEQMLGIE